MTLSVLHAAYFFFRRTVLRADFFAGRRLATAFRFTAFFAAFACLARRFTVFRFLAGPTNRRAPRTAVSAAPVTALAAEFGSAGRRVRGASGNRPRALDAGPGDIGDRVLRRGNDASILGHSVPLWCR